MRSLTTLAPRRLPLPRPRLAARSYATSPRPGATARFYRTFSRLVAKTLLLAVFTYQVAYWAWAKLAADEQRARADGEAARAPPPATVAALEAEVAAYREAKAGAAANDGGPKHP